LRVVLLLLLIGRLQSRLVVLVRGVRLVVRLCALHGKLRCVQHRKMEERAIVRQYLVEVLRLDRTVALRLQVRRLRLVGLLAARLVRLLRLRAGKMRRKRRQSERPSKKYIYITAFRAFNCS
jgi:hypothetical protein